ncbi:MAG: methyltransferase domain-containing protein [bacterium]|nr:methyltransferase domain-containing protein [bacterium]
MPGPQRWEFLKTFFRDPRVASVSPTSPAAVARICQTFDFSSPLTIIELGPGNGAFTRYLLSRMTADSRLLAVELNSTFVATLNAWHDPRLAVVQDSAENLSALLAARGFPPADAAISGIPFSFFPGERQEGIMRQVAEALKPGGVFIVYQFSPQVGAHLKAVFPRVAARRVWRNLPPLSVYDATR